jgi:hypothetical protein
MKTVRCLASVRRDGIDLSIADDPKVSPAYKLFNRIFHILEGLSGRKLSDDNIETAKESMKGSASELYKFLIEYLSYRALG